MSSRLTRSMLAGVILAVVLTTSVAFAASQQTYSQKFTVKHPGQSAGMSFSAAGSTQAKTVTLTFPPGTKINTGALPKCFNTSACPAKSKIGSGQATVMLAMSPIRLPVTAYNRAHGMALAIKSSLGAPVVLAPTLSQGKLTITIPSLQVGDAPLVLTDLKLTISKIGTGSKAYVKTPPSCPKQGAWTFTGMFGYADGTATTLTSQSACVRH